MTLGAGAGIGRHAAETLANKGYTVFAGVRKQKDLDSLLAENKTSNLRPFLLDVTEKESIARAFELIETTLAETGLPFVALINNAGVLQVVPIELAEDKAVRSLMDVNFFGVLEMCREFIPLLRKHPGSRIINISSLAGIVSPPFNGIYSASKFALEAISDAMRRELEEFGIAVIVIQPGFVKTKMNDVMKGDMATIHTHPIIVKYYAAKHLHFLKQGEEGVAVAPGPEVTSRAISEAVTSARPKTRYSCGTVDGNKTPASVLIWMAWLLPDRLLDMFFAPKL